MEAISKAKNTGKMQSELSDSEDLDRVLSAFDSRLDELMWRQDKDGVLYVGDSVNPDLIARVEITSSGSFDVAIADSNDVAVEWHELERVPMMGDETKVQD